MTTGHLPDRPDSEEDVWVWLEDRFGELRSELYRFALSMVRSREDAEDVMQIAFLSAYRALVRGERPARPRAWLFAIALNACRQLLRRRSRWRALVFTGNPDRSVRGGDSLTAAAILHAVDSLPADQRTIFILRELRGLTYAELSERLGLSPAAVESRLARARKRLREQLAARDELPGEQRRRPPLLGIPGALAPLRAASSPVALKLAAGIAGAAAIATGVSVVSTPDVRHAFTPAARPAAAAIHPVGQSGRHPSLQTPVRAAVRARATERRASPPGARPAASARSDPAPAASARTPTPVLVAEAATAAGVEAEAVDRNAAAGNASRAAQPTEEVTSVVDRVDAGLAAAQGAVEDLSAAVPALPVPLAADAEPGAIVPDAPAVVQDAVSGASSGYQFPASRTRAALGRFADAVDGCAAGGLQGFFDAP
jgi:RNA polymerase sigma-70 factor (ECF subfamily)